MRRGLTLVAMTLLVGLALPAPASGRGFQPSAARDRIAKARRDDADSGTPQGPADETAPTGI